MNNLFIFLDLGCEGEDADAWLGLALHRVVSQAYDRTSVFSSWGYFIHPWVLAYDWLLPGVEELLGICCSMKNVSPVVEEKSRYKLLGCGDRKVLNCSPSLCNRSLSVCVRVGISWQASSEAALGMEVYIVQTVTWLWLFVDEGANAVYLGWIVCCRPGFAGYRLWNYVGSLRSWKWSPKLNWGDATSSWCKRTSSSQLLEWGYRLVFWSKGGSSTGSPDRVSWLSLLFFYWPQSRISHSDAKNCLIRSPLKRGGSLPITITAIWSVAVWIYGV